jgi:hypothetical protein
MKVTHRGLMNVNDPAYEEGWTLYMGPQPKRPAETLSEGTPPEKSEAVENQDVEVVKTKK